MGISNSASPHHFLNRRLHETLVFIRAPRSKSRFQQKYLAFSKFFQRRSALSFIVVLLNQYPKTMHSIFSDFAHGIIVHNLADQTFGISHEKSGAARPSVTTHSHPPVTPA